MAASDRDVEFLLERKERTLKCPKCDSDFLHQMEVEVFKRDEEDAESGHHVSVTDESVEVSRDMEGNPSGRRQGIRIHYNCELCNGLEGRVGSLCIVQHKGNEFVYWEVNDDEESEDGA